MPPLYATCPRCGFPAVIRGLERALLRQCRQCREAYIPNETSRLDRRSRGGDRKGHGLTRRATLRAYIRQRRRCVS